MSTKQAIIDLQSNIVQTTEKKNIKPALFF